MSAALRPMTLGEILDRTVQIYRARFWVFVGIAAIPALATLGARLACDLIWGTQSTDFGWAALPQDLLVAFAFYHFTLLFQIIIWPAFVFGATRSLFGEGWSYPQALRRGLSRWSGNLGQAALLLAGTLILPELAVFTFFVGIAGLLSIIVRGDRQIMEKFLDPFLLVFWFGVPIAIGWMSAALSLAVPVRHLEDARPFGALRRGWRLAKGGRFRILMAWLAPALLSLIANVVVLRFLSLLTMSCVPNSILPLRLKIAFVSAGAGWCLPTPEVEAVRIAAACIVTTFLGPIFPIALTLIYYDQRVRQEGYDIELLMAAAGMETAKTADETV